MNPSETTIQDQTANSAVEEAADDEDDIDPQLMGLEDDRAPVGENAVEPIATGLASDLVGGVRQLPARKDIKETVAKRIIRHLTSGEPDGRVKAFSATAVMLRYICDIMGISHIDVPERSKGAKRTLLDAILNKVYIVFFSFARALICLID